VSVTLTDRCTDAGRHAHRCHQKQNRLAQHSWHTKWVSKTILQCANKTAEPSVLHLSCLTITQHQRLQDNKWAGLHEISHLYKVWLYGKDKGDTIRSALIGMETMSYIHFHFPWHAWGQWPVLCLTTLPSTKLNSVYSAQPSWLAALAAKFSTIKTGPGLNPVPLHGSAVS